MVSNQICYPFQKTTLSRCFESSDEWEQILDNVRFAIESVTLPTVGFLGMLANLIVVFVLVRITIKKCQHGKHKSFDRMVICLSSIDFLLIIFYVVDALVQIDILHEPQWYQVRRTTIYFGRINQITTGPHMVFSFLIFILNIIEGHLSTLLASYETSIDNCISVHGCSDQC